MWDFNCDLTVTTAHPTLTFAAEYMVRQLHAQGLAARVWQNHVVFGVAQYWGRCREATIRPGSGIAVTSLCFDLYTDRNKTDIVSDQIAGVGATPRESMQDAVCNYLSNVFLAFQRRENPTLASEMPKMSLESYCTATQRATTWDVFSGGGLVNTGAESAEAFLHAMAKQPPLALILDEVTGLLSADDRLHWVKLFGCRQATGEIVSECELDNAPSLRAKEQLEQFRWPRSSEMQSFRQFYVLNPRR